MANFNNAFNLVLKNEGSYSNDPDDPGGETYKGISRKTGRNGLDGILLICLNISVLFRRYLTHIKIYSKKLKSSMKLNSGIQFQET